MISDAGVDSLIGFVKFSGIPSSALITWAKNRFYPTKTSLPSIKNRTKALFLERLVNSSVMISWPLLWTNLLAVREVNLHFVLAKKADNTTSFAEESRLLAGAVSTPEILLPSPVLYLCFLGMSESREQEGSLLQPVVERRKNVRNEEGPTGMDSCLGQLIGTVLTRRWIKIGSRSDAWTCGEQDLINCCGSYWREWVMHCQ